MTDYTRTSPARRRALYREALGLCWLIWSLTTLLLVGYGAVPLFVGLWVATGLVCAAHAAGIPFDLITGPFTGR